MDTLRFSLDQEQLQPYRAAWNRAVQSQRGRDPAALLDAAQARLDGLAERPMPSFVRERMALVPKVLAMLRDRDWNADEQVRAGLSGALAYLEEPEDMIPDAHPRFGLLDDALVMEIALAAYRGEWLAWQEFAAFRRRHSPDAPLDREDWLLLRLRARRGSDAAAALFRQGRPSYLDLRGAPRDAFRIH